MASSSRAGLEWDDSGLDLVPRWARQPDIEAIERLCRRVLSIGANDVCSVSYHAEGAFNKLYVVQSPKGKMMMRVSLPVDPAKKTYGEVATLRWVRSHTDIPVPEVIAFDASRDNDIGFEWILMELMPGVSAYKRWRGMSMAQKAALVERVAELQAQLLNSYRAEGAFRGIGTLKPSATDGDGGEWPVLGHMVSMLFFWGDHFDHDIPRGPFRSSHDWVDAHLSIMKLDHVAAMEQAEDDEDRQDAEKAKRVAERLSGLAPRIFPSIQDPPERTVPWHQDLSLSKILVGEKGTITAVIDWECVSTMPVWAACEVPKFLDGSTREDEPDRDRYGDESENGSDKGQAEDGEEDVDNEGKNELYWIHLMEYEQTQLREVYAARMQQLHPGWSMEVEESLLKQDILSAISLCGDGICLRRIDEWVDDIEKGVFRRLRDVINPPVE